MSKDPRITSNEDQHFEPAVERHSEYQRGLEDGLKVAERIKLEFNSTMEVARKAKRDTNELDWADFNVWIDKQIEAARGKR